MLLARTARRLRDDFELNPNGLALAMRLLATVEALECELDRLRAGMARPQHR
jgi:chaperone modulatory protein CbpM